MLDALLANPPKRRRKLKKAKRSKKSAARLASGMTGDLKKIVKEEALKAYFKKSSKKKHGKKLTKKHAKKLTRSQKKISRKAAPKKGKISKYRGYGKQITSKYGKRFRKGVGSLYLAAKPKIRKLKKIDVKKVSKAAKKAVGVRNLSQGYEVLINKRRKSMKRKHKANPVRRHRRSVSHRRNPSKLLTTKNILQGVGGLFLGMYGIAILKKVPVVGGLVEKVDGLSKGYLSPVAAIALGYLVGRKSIRGKDLSLLGDAIMLGGAVTILQKLVPMIPVLGLSGIENLGEVELQGIEVDQSVGAIENMSGLEGLGEEVDMGALVPEGLSDVGEEMYQ